MSLKNSKKERNEMRRIDAGAKNAENQNFTLVAD